VAADSYSDLAQKLGVANRLRYAGVVPFEELLAYYSIATLKVLPSTMDGFGMALIEAMGMGVPVIGTRSQGIIDVIGADEKNGLLFDDNNIPQLVQQIQRFLSDEILRKHYIEQGKKALVEQFSIQRTIQEYEQFFQTLLVKHTKQ
ncbi:MAG TPA: glycosyltransferase family 4 protein, partial [Chitinophagales bacterium]|nr:glycosyltransferase family 4 protein [Chitinophagales bacterium]